MERFKSLVCVICSVVQTHSTTMTDRSIVEKCHHKRLNAAYHPWHTVCDVVWSMWQWYVHQRTIYATTWQIVDHEVRYTVSIKIHLYCATDPCQRHTMSASLLLCSIDWWIYGVHWLSHFTQQLSLNVETNVLNYGNKLCWNTLQQPKFYHSMSHFYKYDYTCFRIRL